MRILQVITDTDRRGAQVFATDLEAALRRRDHALRTVALTPGDRVPGLDVDVLGRHARGISTVRRLRTEMAEVELTVAHGSSTLAACSLAGIGSGREFVYRQISDSRFWAPTVSRRTRVTMYLRRPRRIVALSVSASETLQTYLRVPPERIDVVPNGVPEGSFAVATTDQRRAARAELGLPSEAIIALYIGALVPEKGADLAVASLAQLPEVHLAVAGGGPELEHLEAMAQRTALGRVHFLGQRSDTLPAYQASDLVVLPSKGGDSMPATLIEAGFCGLPSVSTPVGAIGEIVRHDETGLMVPIDDLDAFTEAVRSLAGDADRRASLGARARERCHEQFEIDVVAASWERTLESALADAGS